MVLFLIVKCFHTKKQQHCITVSGILLNYSCHGNFLSADADACQVCTGGVCCRNMLSNSHDNSLTLWASGHEIMVVNGGKHFFFFLNKSI